MDALKEKLKASGLTNKQIDSFIIHFDNANKKKIPYPYYYAFSKIKS